MAYPIGSVLDADRDPHCPHGFRLLIQFEENVDDPIKEALTIFRRVIPLDSIKVVRGSRISKNDAGGEWIYRSTGYRVYIRRQA